MITRSRSGSGKKAVRNEKPYSPSPTKKAAKKRKTLPAKPVPAPAPPAPPALVPAPPAPAPAHDAWDMDHGELFVTCPYCEGLMEPCCLFDHVFASHEANHDHERACPICVLFYGWDDSRPSGNLLAHLRQTHPEMDGASRSAAMQHLPDNEADFDLDRASLGSSYARILLKESDTLTADQECPICLVEFAPGQSAVRMDCWCLYHSDCLTAWWDKKGESTCPTHIFDASYE